MALQVDFSAGKVTETVTGKPARTIIDTDKTNRTLTSVLERTDDEFRVPAGAVDYPIGPCKIDDAKFLAMYVESGTLLVKFNTDTEAKPFEMMVWAGAGISGILATNPSSTEVRTVHVYAATTTT